MVPGHAEACLTSRGTPEVVLDEGGAPVGGQKAAAVKASLPRGRGGERREAAAVGRGQALPQRRDGARRAGHGHRGPPAHGPLCTVLYCTVLCTVHPEHNVISSPLELS